MLYDTMTSEMSLCYMLQYMVLNSIRLSVFQYLNRFVWKKAPQNPMCYAHFPIFDGYLGIPKPLKSQTPRKKRSFPTKVELLEINYFQDSADYTNIRAKCYEHPGWDIYEILTRCNSLHLFYLHIVRSVSSIATIEFEAVKDAKKV